MRVIQPSDFAAGGRRNYLEGERENKIRKWVVRWSVASFPLLSYSGLLFDVSRVFQDPQLFFSPPI